MKKRIIIWLIAKLLKGFHLSKNPDRKKKEVKGNGE
jgi:hypothetical protein